VVDALLNGSFLNLFRHFRDSARAKSTSTTLASLKYLNVKMVDAPENIFFVFVRLPKQNKTKFILGKTGKVKMVDALEDNPDI
jgi:hypothetical protein